MRGGHHIKSWSVTQKSVTLSSAEAELAACIKTSTETIGVLQMVETFGTKVTGEIFVDSSAALAVVGRKGNGRMRHIRVGHLWIQQVAEDETLAYRKVVGTDNPADINTKHVNQRLIDRALSKVEMRLVGGRAESGLTVSCVGIAGGGVGGGGGTVGAATAPTSTQGQDRAGAQWEVHTGDWADDCLIEET